MPRKNEFGKYVLSAGEISSYVVCPEAWRLNHVDTVRKIDAPEAVIGDKLHQSWTANLHEAEFFTRAIRQLLILIIVSVCFFLIRLYFRS